MASSAIVKWSIIGCRWYFAMRISMENFRSLPFPTWQESDACVSLRGNRECLLPQSSLSIVRVAAWLPSYGGLASYHKESVMNPSHDFALNGTPQGFRHR